jgi:3-oxoacyl-[acyl-carrier protein] reductase
LNFSIVLGCSRGLGFKICESLLKDGDEVLGFSRTPVNIQHPRFRWIEIDLRHPSQAALIMHKSVGNSPVNKVVYNAGIYEKDEFGMLEFSEIESIINVNFVSCLFLLKTLELNLSQVESSRVLLVGSTCGLENENNPAVIYTATKFALRGVGHSLRCAWRSKGIQVSVLNPGSMRDDDKGSFMTYQEVAEIINFVLKAPKSALFKEIDLPSFKDTDL